MPLADPVLVALCASVLLILVLLLAILKSHDRRTRAVQLLGALIILALGWSVIVLLARLQQVGLTAAFDQYALERVSVYLLLLIAVCFFQVTRQFQRLAAYRQIGMILGITTLLASILLFENPFRLPDLIQVTPGMFLDRLPSAFVILITGWAGLMGSALYLSGVGLYKAVSPLHRNRYLFWITTAVLIIAGQAMIFFRLIIPGSLVQVAGLGLGCFTLLTHNLPDLRSGSRRAVGYVVFTIIAAGLFTAGFALIQYLPRRFPGFNLSQGGLLLALVMAVLILPILGLIQRTMNNMSLGIGYEPHQMLSEYSQTISNILDLDTLATLAVGRINEVMEISGGALFTVDTHDQPAASEAETRAEIHIIPINTADQKHPGGRLSEKSALAAALGRDHYPLTQYDIDLLPRFLDIAPEERAWIAQLAMDVYIPIYSKGSWIGLLAFGPKNSGDRYFNADLVILQSLADQTAIALENARLYANLKHRNAENERLNQDLRRVNVELERMDKAKLDFINIASHELRTPLTQVMGYNDILREMITNDSVEHDTAVVMVNGVRKAARRLDDIVEIMFDVSKLESGTLGLNCAPVSLASIISSAVDNWQKGLDDRQQSINVRGLAGLPLVNGDARRLTQVFSNLIQNAIKYTPDGGLVQVYGRVVDYDVAPNDQIVVPPAERQPAEAWVEVVVSDNGIGIDRQELERIYLKFYRVGSVLQHSSGEIKFKGAGPGLGLTIARGIITAHGGRIWAESPGYDESACPGASFHVLLPVR